MSEPSKTYPAELETDVALRDGSVAHIRPIQPDDEPALLTFLRALSDDDRRLRFFSLGNNLARTAHDEATVDYVHSLGLLVIAGSPQRIVGHAFYAPSGEARAEVAFAIATDYQGRGLATILLGQLAGAAAAQGIETFEAVVLSENRRMLQVFRHSGFPVSTQFEWGSVEATFPTSLTPAALARFEQREELSSASALRRVLYPHAVAVVGASERPGGVGAAVLRNLVAAGFRGPTYPVNPAGGSMQSLPAYHRVESIPGPVDLAVIAVPAPTVVRVAEQCGRKGVQSLVVLSTGFSESGVEGEQRQADLLRVCRAFGMRLIGPNGIGVLNTDPSAPLNATFAPRMPLPGRIGMATQSGALGLAAIDFASARYLGFSSLVSMGNKADISGNDLLGYWHTDPRTSVILLYLESFGNPRKFARVARAVGRAKPIVALKSGRSPVGARAPASRTAGWLLDADVTVDALFQQAGVIRTDTLEETLDVADLLVHQPLPAGRRVAIVTNVGGPAVMCADACESRGLEVPALSESTQQQLRDMLPPGARVTNPVDMLATATAEQYTRVVRAVAADPNVDALISIFLPPLVTQADEVARALCSALDQPAPVKPVLAVFMSTDRLPELELPGDKRIPGYRTPEPAALALAHAAGYAAWQARPAADPPSFPDVQRDEAGVLLAAALHREESWLTPDEARQLLGQYGVRSVEPGSLVTPAGVAMLVGVVNDPQFGPTIACGAGGVLMELVKDVAVRLSPLTREDATNMLHELRSFPLLDGYRGAQRCDISGLQDLLLRISALVEDHPQIAELECSPVIVGTSGALVVDVHVRVAGVPPRRPLGARRP